MKRLLFAISILIFACGCASENSSSGLWRHAEKCPADTTTHYHRIILQSVVHASLFHELGALDHVVGLFEMDAVTDSVLKAALRRQGVVDLGSSVTPQLEKIVSLKPDALFLSPLENGGFGALEKCHVPIVECADYMETTPLGRAEWMRWLGRLVECGQKADSLFASVETQYASLKKDTQKQTLLVDFPQFGSWYVPGGKSYLAQLYADAGYKYVFADNESEGSAPMTFEAVYQKAKSADVWIVKYGSPNDYTKDDLLQIDSRLSAFAAFENGRLWGCNTYRVPYYELTPFHPERLLKDLLEITTSDGYFYKRLK